MSRADDEWVKAAMSDDKMVVELLVRLHGAAASGRTPLPKAAVALPLEWSVRQRRSKPLSSAANSQKSQAQRASPTTPLSWSAATSISGGSGGGGGEESSSRPLPQKPPSAARSKVNGDSEKTTLKRSRKKKTLAELRVEENSLQKEKRELKREIAAARMNLENQRTTNENLKRLKIEFPTLPGRNITVADESTSDQLKQQKTLTRHCKPDGGAVSNSKLMLPDLNIPFEENSCTDIIWSRLG